MDTITKVDNSSYSTIASSVVTHSVSDDALALTALQGQLDTNAVQKATIETAIQQITDRLTAASQAGVSDATLALDNQSNVQG